MFYIMKKYFIPYLALFFQNASFHLHTLAAEDLHSLSRYLRIGIQTASTFFFTFFL